MNIITNLRARFNLMEFRDINLNIFKILPGLIIINLIKMVKLTIKISLITIIGAIIFLATASTLKLVKSIYPNQEKNIEIEVFKSEVTKELESIKYEMNMISKENVELIEYNNSINETNVKLSNELDMYKKYGYVMSNRKYPLPLDVVQLIDQLGKKYKISPHVIIALINVESSFNPNASARTSSARGYGQFIKGTGEWVWEKILKKDTKYNHDMAYDPIVNVELIYGYVNYLLKVKKGNFRSAMIAYNGNDIGPEFHKRMNRFLLANTDRSIGEYERDYKLNN